MAYDLPARNHKLIHAVQQRAQQLCPDALALIGIYGSFATGGYSERSDLDLLILIHDERGYQLSCCFIQDDLGVGHDLYCTTWESLEDSARQYSPAMPKLLDAQVVWSDGEATMDRFRALQAQAQAWMDAPYGAADLQQSEEMYNGLCTAYAEIMTAADRNWAGAAMLLYQFENLHAQLHKTCYRRSTRYRLEELPPEVAAQVDALCRAESADALKSAATTLVKTAQTLLAQRRESLRTSPAPATAEALQGSYEECVSNWRGKAQTAAEIGDARLMLDALGNLEAMLLDIAGELDIPRYNVLGSYDPTDLTASARHYDAILARYALEYERVGLPIRHYADIDEMIADYTKA